MAMKRHKDNMAKEEYRSRKTMRWPSIVVEEEEERAVGQQEEKEIVGNPSRGARLSGRCV